MRLLLSQRDYPVVVLCVVTLAFVVWLWRDATAAPPTYEPPVVAVAVFQPTAPPPDAPPMFVPPPE